MAVKARSIASQHGPQGFEAAWVDSGETLGFAAFTATATVTTLPLSIVPQVTLGSDTLLTANIQRLFGGQFALVTALAAQATVTLGVAVYRANTLLGGSVAFGWRNADGGTPAFSALTTVAMPAVAANTALLTNESGLSYLALNPGDILVLRATSTGSVNVPLGAISAEII